MKNVVIISGHPDLKISVANKTILEEISAKCPQADNIIECISSL